MNDVPDHDDDADTEPVPPIQLSDWVSVIELDPGSSGVTGGSWRLAVTRISDEESSHWWGTVGHDDGDGVVRHHTPGGQLVRVQVADDRPFWEAAEAFGLDRTVFGSETLWPAVHMQAAAADQGWVWLHTERAAPFPFVADSP